MFLFYFTALHWSYFVLFVHWPFRLLDLSPVFTMCWTFRPLDLAYFVPSVFCTKHPLYQVPFGPSVFCTMCLVPSVFGPSVFGPTVLEPVQGELKVHLFLQIPHHTSTCSYSLTTSSCPPAPGYKK